MSDTLTRAKKLFDLGAHLGHRKSRLHPRARKYVYQIKDGVSIIDLEQTINQIDIASSALIEAAQNNKTVLIVATKKAVSIKAAELAKDTEIYYVVSKWLPGLLTNFNTITKNVKKLNELKRQKEVGEWAKFVKHEQMALQKELFKLERLYGGITNMHKVPEIMLVIDIKREKNAVKEAKTMGVPVVAIVDTNCNPEDVKYPIMLNDDTPAAIEAVMSDLIADYKKNKVEEKPAAKTPETVVIPPPTVVSPEEKSASKPEPKNKVDIEKVSEDSKKTPAKKKVVVKKEKKTKTKTTKKAVK